MEAFVIYHAGAASQNHAFVKVIGPRQHGLSLPPFQWHSFAKATRFPDRLQAKAIARSIRGPVCILKESSVTWRPPCDHDWHWTGVFRRVGELVHKLFHCRTCCVNRWMPNRSSEADEVSYEDLEAAGVALDDLKAGTFYAKQEAAHQWLRNRRTKGDT